MSKDIHETSPTLFIQHLLPQLPLKAFDIEVIPRWCVLRMDAVSFCTENIFVIISLYQCNRLGLDAGKCYFPPTILTSFLTNISQYIRKYLVNIFLVTNYYGVCRILLSVS